jgi:hypothetical protein
MKDSNPHIKTGTFNEFIEDVAKIYTSHINSANGKLLVQYLALYYTSTEDNMSHEQDVFGLLQVDPVLVQKLMPLKPVRLERVVYSTLAFLLKDKKFYKTAERRGLV